MPILKDTKQEILIGRGTVGQVCQELLWAVGLGGLTVFVVLVVLANRPFVGAGSGPVWLAMITGLFTSVMGAIPLQIVGATRILFDEAEGCVRRVKGLGIVPLWRSRACKGDVLHVGLSRFLQKTVYDGYGGSHEYTHHEVRIYFNPHTRGRLRRLLFGEGVKFLHAEEGDDEVAAYVAEQVAEFLNVPVRRASLLDRGPRRMGPPRRPLEEWLTMVSCEYCETGYGNTVRATHETVPTIHGKTLNLCQDHFDRYADRSKAKTPPPGS